jgi:hypothetical protein
VAAGRHQLDVEGEIENNMDDDHLVGTFTVRPA